MINTSYVILFLILQKKLSRNLETNRYTIIRRSTSNVATKGKSITKPRTCHGTVSRKSNRERASTVPQLLQGLSYRYPRIREKHIKTTLKNTNDRRLTMTTPHFEEWLERDELTNELSLPLTSSVVPKSKHEMLYVHLDFENNLTKDALIHSGAYFSAIASKDLDTKKQKAPKNIFKIDDLPNFQIQVANGHLEKPLATTTPKFDFEDNTFAELFDVLKKLTGPIIGLQFMRNNSVVMDTTNGVIHFRHLTMQVKLASIETSAELQPFLTDDALTKPPRTTKTITTFVDHFSGRTEYNRY